MKSFLPCHPPHHTTVRDRLGRVATGLEKSRRASGDPVEAPPKGGLTVFLDGAHIRCRPEYQQRHLDLVVGKIESRNMCRRFGLVANATASPSSRMREELSDYGWKPGRLLTVISDGELALPNLIRNAVGGRSGGSGIQASRGAGHRRGGQGPRHDPARSPKPPWPGDDASASDRRSPGKSRRGVFDR